VIVSRLFAVPVLVFIGGARKKSKIVKLGYEKYSCRVT
jgi:hypothetical protein